MAVHVVAPRSQASPAGRELHSAPQSAQPFEARPLNGLDVLIDTYNLRLPQGSGIKSYGLTLIQALRALGSQVSLLSDRSVPHSSEKVLRQVLFFDARKVQPPPPRRVLARLARRGLGLSRVEEIPLDQVVPDTTRLAGASESHRAFNSPGCYEDAHRIFSAVRVPTRLRLPEKVPLWHATCPMPIHIRGAKRITTVHDLIPLRLPHTTLDDKVTFYRTVKDAIRTSELLIAVSEHTRQDLLEYFDVNPEKIVVGGQAPLRVLPEIPVAQAGRVLARYRLKPRDYILFVGNLEPKKNVKRLIEAFAGLDTDKTLVLVGRKAWLWKGEIGQAERLLGRKRYRENFKLLDFVPREALEILYASAEFLVFPSLYEGFGLPPLEAMQFGCPTIVSQTSSLPEVCAEASLYVDPYDVRDIRAKMGSLLEHPALRETLVKRGFERVQHYSPEAYQRRLLEAYRRIL